MSHPYRCEISETRNEWFISQTKWKGSKSFQRDGRKKKSSSCITEIWTADLFRASQQAGSKWRNASKIPRELTPTCNTFILSIKHEGPMRWLPNRSTLRLFLPPTPPFLEVPGECVPPKRGEGKKRKTVVQVTGHAPEREAKGIVFPVQQCVPSQTGRQLPGGGLSRLDGGARAPNRRSLWATALVWMCSSPPSS